MDQFDKDLTIERIDSEKPQPTPELKQQLPPEMISTIEKFVSNPLFSIAAKSHIPEIQKYISDNAGDYEEAIYWYLKEKHPSIYNLLQPDEDSAGQENEGNSGKYTQERSNEEFEGNEDETISKEIWEEILTEMVRLTDEGNSPGKIKDFIYDDYGVELTHQQIMKDVQRFKQSLKAQQIAEEEEKAELEAEQAKEEKRRINAQQKILTLNEKYQAAKDEIAELKQKLAVKEAIEQVKNPKAEKQQEETHRGLIRTALHYLY